MRVLTVPNWSFFDPALCDSAVSESCSQVSVHYAQGDADHVRTVTAFSGDVLDVFSALDQLCDRILPAIDLGVGGVHPFVGALDVVPFVILEGSEAELVGLCREWVARFSSRFDIPVHLYERAAFPGQERRLPVLRGQLGVVEKGFDFGSFPHPRWGYSVVGVRDFLLAVNFNFASGELATARRLAKDIRGSRESGEARFAGVRALAFGLEKQQFAQLSLNMTMPDRTSLDEVCAWVASQRDAEFEVELIGVIRDVDLPKATRLWPMPSQIVPTL